MVPPTPSTAATGLSSPVAVTMTVSLGLADAAGTPASDVPASTATTAAPAVAIRRLFRPAGRDRRPSATPNDPAIGISKPPQGVLGPAPWPGSGKSRTY